MSQLTNELRPTTWDSVIGQDENIELLQCIIKNPNEAPKVLIFEGEMGTGKTSCARIFAREINGISVQEFEKETNSCHFEEYDSSQLPVDECTLSNMFKNVFWSDGKWKVILLDEFQALSSHKQTSLLKPLEQLGEMVFVILTTTDIGKIQKPLRSRALEIRFGAVPYEDILAHLDYLEQRYKKPISVEAKQHIAHRAHGHMRNAHMLVNKYFIQGDESFMRNAFTTMDCLCSFFISALEKSSHNIEKYLNTLVDKPLTELREDFDEFIIKCAQETIGIPSNNDNIARVAKAYGNNFNVVVNIYFQKWVSSMFNSDIIFHLSMMNFYKIIKDSPKQ